jgi:putative intracellular protease/amidase
MSAKKILMLVGDYVEDYEAMVPFQTTASNAVTDGNLVGALAWPADPEWMKQFLKVLGSTIEA